MTAPQPPPEAALIRQRREDIVPKLGRAEAARRTGGHLSESRWRQLENGYRVTAAGREPQTAPAETLARMAQVVGVTPAELESRGRGDAARILGVLLAQEPAPEAEPDYAELVRRHAELAEEQRQQAARFEASQQQMARQFEEKLDRALREREPDDKEEEPHEDNGSRRAG
jgi:transcriptional regulator with XRE-family HTH domain